jgi:hypothetical protein
VTNPTPQQPAMPTLDLTDLPNGGKHLVLPGGGWIDFAHPKTISKGKHRKQIYGRVSNWDNAAVAGLEVLEAIAAVLITGWELPDLPNAPLPKGEPGMIGELDGPDYDMVLLYAKDVRAVIMPDTGLADSPTGPASA